MHLWPHFNKSRANISDEIATYIPSHIVYCCQLISLQLRHNEQDGISNHQPHDCLLNRLLRRRSTKMWRLHVTGLCEGNSPETSELPAQRASNVENVSIWWSHVYNCFEGNLDHKFVHFQWFKMKLKRTNIFIEVLHMLMKIICFRYSILTCTNLDCNSIYCTAD